ncbi:fibrinogen-like protein 1 [Drosophila innubila]|uniref:fibrinogen-like protein 1 n=1 Tax=Drosophila innubila TaxID=198719 RepID=UPI00148BC911|nr:fibrinogen-like protein 1 [Drosophila innubila]
MKILLVNLIVLLIAVLIKSNNEHEQSTTSNEMEYPMEGQCYEYCFNIIQPMLEQTVSMKMREQQIQEQSTIFRTLENKLAHLLAKVEIYEETIKNKHHQMPQQLLDSEKRSNEMAVKLGICEETIRNKDLELAQQLQASETCKNETIDKNNMIESRNELHSQMKDKLQKIIVTVESTLASSCIGKLNDIYEIKVPGMEAFSVSCDSSLAGSGWTVFQRRMDGSVNFNRNWTDYRQGFGDLQGEFFIGLEKLYLLTRSQPHELYISLTDFANETRYARYSDFVIGSEEEAYELKQLGKYAGNAGDSMIDHANMKFSTPDKKHNTGSRHCAKEFSSGWWFCDCYMCNLNGLYVYEDSNKDVISIEWRDWKKGRPMKFTQMMIKPKSD